MLLNDLNNKDSLYRIVISELKACGIKFRLDKNVKHSMDTKSNKIFSTSLELLELTEVNVTGGTVPIPTFVYDACSFITAHINTEGLFRKAGSTTRQKQIKAYLEMGHKLGKQHYAIDVANILKSFFRDLSKPIIPPGNVQDSMLKCLINADKHADNLLLICLLMPPLTLNTFAYFMQFLNKISENSSVNKMTIQNLSIIFAPSLMPLNQMSEGRLNGHVRVINLLIENASKIGVIAGCLLSKVQNITDTMNGKNTIDLRTKRKIRRRSGSLTRILTGLRKIVGGAGSNENLSTMSPEPSVKPCINRSTKKRALEMPIFSVKKKKNILAMQQQPESMTSSTPILKKRESKLNLGLKERNVLKARTSNKSSQTRRWSFAESPPKCNRKCSFVKLTPTSSPRSSLPFHNEEKDINQSFSNEITIPQLHRVANAPCLLSSNAQNESQVKSEYVKIGVEEYIEINERVKCLERRISEEFKCFSNYDPLDVEKENTNVSGPERVQNKFEITLENTENLNENSITGQLANHLKQELRIRNKNDAVIRSPSERKIETLRRKSRELTLTNSSRISSKMAQSLIFCDNSLTEIVKSSPNLKPNLNRDKPNIVTTGLTNSLPLAKDIRVLTSKSKLVLKDCSSITPKCRKSVKNLNLKICAKPSASILLIPTKFKSSTSEECSITVPISNHKKAKLMITNSNPTMRSSLLTKQLNLQLNGNTGMNSIDFLPEIKEQTGRASIVKIRVQNAGMVLEKAKLFNGMSNKTKI